MMIQKNQSRVREDVCDLNSVNLSRSIKPKITLYSTSICPWCRITKEFLREHKIKFRELDVVGNINSLKKMIQKSGQMSVPVIEINGNIIVGFDEDRLREEIGI